MGPRARLVSVLNLLTLLQPAMLATVTLIIAFVLLSVDRTDAQGGLSGSANCTENSLADLNSHLRNVIAYVATLSAVLFVCLVSLAAANIACITYCLVKKRREKRTEKKAIDYVEAGNSVTSPSSQVQSSTADQVHSENNKAYSALAQISENQEMGDKEHRYAELNSLEVGEHTEDIELTHRNTADKNTANEQEDTEDGYEELNDIVQDELTDHKEDIKLPGNQGSAHGNTVDRKTDGTGDKAHSSLLAGSSEVQQCEDTEDGYAVLTDSLEVGRFPTPDQQVPKKGKKASFYTGHYEIGPLSDVEDIYEGSICDEPFWLPANIQEELFSQIINLNVSIIPDEEIILQDTLGSGQFGMVHKGAWVREVGENKREVSTEVAVKTMRDGASEEDTIKFLQEAAIMGQFRQPNILRIQGIIMEGDSLRIVTELMRNGDLLQHLAYVKKTIPDRTSCETKQMLMSFSRQVVNGLAYLYWKSFVHRDLAARNVLVSRDCICKIADFGLSRDLQNENYYKSQGGKIPVKWTAPEAINYRKYSTASDVWSYGCVLYEIWSMGEKPFAGYTNIEALRTVLTGYRLPPPAGCSLPIYTIMMDCWDPDPELRPNPGQIVTMLQKPDYKYVEWSPEEEEFYSEKSRTLGEDLENGHCLHVDLQKKYLAPKVTSSDSSVVEEQA